MIIYLDTETTGLRPGNICQLSYIIQDRNDITAKNFFFSVDFVEYGAYSVHGFSVEKLKSLSCGRVFSDHLEEIELDFNKADCIVAHNTSFDFMFLRAEFSSNGSVFAPNNEFCTMKKSISMCKLARSKGVGYKYPKLSELTAYLGITDEQVLACSRKLFRCECGYHDARFDTCAVFLAVNRAVSCFEPFEILKNYL